MECLPSLHDQLSTEISNVREIPVTLPHKSVMYLELSHYPPENASCILYTIRIGRFVLVGFSVGIHQILFLPDIRPAGYPANQKAGYRIPGKGRIPDIR
jgi:hypothetical protein